LNFFQYLSQGAGAVWKQEYWLSLVTASDWNLSRKQYSNISDNYNRTNGNTLEVVTSHSLRI